MNEDKLINKYLAVLKKVTTITARLRTKGEYTNKQLMDISMLLAGELPKMVFTEEELKVLAESSKLKSMSISVESTKGRGM